MFAEDGISCRLHEEFPAGRNWVDPVSALLTVGFSLNPKPLVNWGGEYRACEEPPVRKALTVPTSLSAC